MPDGAALLTEEGRTRSVLGILTLEHDYGPSRIAR